MGQQMKNFFIVLGIVFIVFVIAATNHSNDPVAQAKQDARDKIKACWQEQERKSNTPSTARVFASICEDFEATFRKTYGHSH